MTDSPLCGARSRRDWVTHTHTGLTISACAELDAQGVASCRRPESSDPRLREWRYPRDHARIASTVDLAARDWVARTAE